MSQPRKAGRILVIDDEEDVRGLLGQVLGDAGYDVLMSVDGEEAVRRIESSRPDLVILDLMMPGFDGWGVLERLRGMAGGPPPFLVLTARSDFASFTRAVREGVAAYVFKPFRIRELLVTCDRILHSAESKASGVILERRHEPRRTLTVEVKVLSKEKAPIVLGDIINLSPGGAQVDLAAPLDPGELVCVAFHIPGGGSPLTLEGRVQWQQPATEGFSHGLVFTNLTPEGEEEFRDLLRGPA